MTTLQERMDEFKKSFESGAPPYNAPHHVIETMHRATAELKASGIEGRALKIGVLTPELEHYTRALHKKLNLTFDLLTDLHLKTAEEFRLVFTLPDYLRELYKSVGGTLDRFNDESEYRLPIPARYVIDKEGIIRSAEVNADYTIRPEPSETVRMLRTLSTRRRDSVVDLEKD